VLLDLFKLLGLRADRNLFLRSIQVSYFGAGIISIRNGHLKIEYNEVKHLIDIFVHGRLYCLESLEAIERHLHFEAGLLEQDLQSLKLDDFVIGDEAPHLARPLEQHVRLLRGLENR